MKEFENLLKWLIPLAVIAAVGNATLNSLFNQFASGDPQGLFGMTLGQTLSFITMVKPIIGLMTKIAIAIWLFFVARTAGASRWLWALFGVTFGLWAIGLFYLVRLYENISNDRKKPELNT